MIEQTIDTRPSLDANIVRDVAHALWSVDLSDRQIDADPEQRRESWAAEKTQFISKARRLIRQLKRKGFELHPIDSADAS
jgi:hypothetical protein